MSEYSNERTVTLLLVDAAALSEIDVSAIQGQLEAYGATATQAAVLEAQRFLLFTFPSASAAMQSALDSLTRCGERSRGALVTGDLNSGERVRDSALMAGVSQLLDYAQAGQLLVSQTTWELREADAEFTREPVEMGRLALQTDSRRELIRGWNLAAPEFSLPPRQGRSTLFVGREEELNVIQERLKDASVLVLVGRGGLGKTAIATQYSMVQSGNYPDGVFWVDFSACQTREQAQIQLDSVLSTVPLKFGRHLRALWIFDDIDHLPDLAVAMYWHLRRRFVGSDLLVLSRRSLDRSLPEMRVRELPVAEPRPDEPPCEAIALFIERVHQRSSRLGVARLSPAEVYSVVQALDGRAYLIEIAAAKAAILGLEVVKELVERNPLDLVNPYRNFSPRHRSLAASFQATMVLFPPTVSLAFRALAELPGSWTIAKAIDLLAEIGVARPDLDEAIEILMDADLIQPAPGVSSDRYTIAPLDRLAAAASPLPLPETWTKAWLDYHRRWAKSCLAEIDTSIEPELLRAISLDLDELRSVLDTAGPADEEAQALVHLLARFYSRRGQISLARETLQSAFLAANGPGADAFRGELARVHALNGAFEPAHRILRELEGALPHVRGAATLALVEGYLRHGQLARVPELLMATEEHWREGSNGQIRLRLRLARAQLALFEKNSGDAQPILMEVRGECVIHPSWERQIQFWNLDGQLRTLQGDSMRAELAFREALELAAALDDVLLMMPPLIGIAELDFAFGSYRHAATILGILETLLSAHSATPFPIVVRRARQLYERLESAIPSDALIQAYVRGQRMPREEILAYAAPDSARE